MTDLRLLVAKVVQGGQSLVNSCRTNSLYTAASKAFKANITSLSLEDLSDKRVFDILEAAEDVYSKCVDVHMKTLNVESLEAPLELLRLHGGDFLGVESRGSKRRSQVPRAKLVAVAEASRALLKGYRQLCKFCAEPQEDQQAFRDKCAVVSDLVIDVSFAADKCHGQDVLLDKLVSNLRERVNSGLQFAADYYVGGRKEEFLLAGMTGDFDDAMAEAVDDILSIAEGPSIAQPQQHASQSPRALLDVPKKRPQGPKKEPKKREATYREFLDEAGRETKKKYNTAVRGAKKLEDEDTAAALKLYRKALKMIPKGSNPKLEKKVKKLKKSLS